MIRWFQTQSEQRHETWQPGYSALKEAPLETPDAEGETPLRWHRCPLSHIVFYRQPTAFFYFIFKMVISWYTNVYIILFRHIYFIDVKMLQCLCFITCFYHFLKHRFFRFRKLHPSAAWGPGALEPFLARGGRRAVEAVRNRGSVRHFVEKPMTHRLEDPKNDEKRMILMIDLWYVWLWFVIGVDGLKLEKQQRFDDQ